MGAEVTEFPDWPNGFGPRLLAAPPDIANCRFYRGIDPFTKQEVVIARGLRDRKLQRALMQFFQPENWFAVREDLIEARRQDLIGSGCNCLIPANPPEMPSKRGGEPRTAWSRATKTTTITTPSPTRPGASSPGSGACRTRVIGQGARRRAVRTRSANGQAAAQACDRKGAFGGEYRCNRSPA